MLWTFPSSIAPGSAQVSRDREEGPLPAEPSWSVQICLLRPFDCEVCFRPCARLPRRWWGLSSPLQVSWGTRRGRACGGPVSRARWGAVCRAFLETMVLGCVWKVLQTRRLSWEAGGDACSVSQAGAAPTTFSARLSAMNLSSRPFCRFHKPRRDIRSVPRTLFVVTRPT